MASDAMKPGTFFLLFKTDAGEVMIDPAAVVAVGASATIGRCNLFIGGGAMEVHATLGECCAVVAKAMGKAIVRP